MTSSKILNFEQMFSILENFNELTDDIL
jgi:hypothetical protein